jgi:TonB family protein
MTTLTHAPISVEPMNRETRLVMMFVGISLGLHLVVLLADFSGWLSRPLTKPDEWIIDADLVTDLDLGGVKQDQLPDAKKAEEAAVAKMLPQIPKNFTIQDLPKPQEETVPDAQVKEQPKPEVKKEEPPPETLPKPEDATNSLAMKDALKRLAMEKLRREQEKTVKETEAPKDEALAKLRSELDAKGIGGGLGGGAGKAKLSKCAALIEKALRRAYALPDAYNFTNSDLRVGLTIVLAENGAVMSLKVAQASGDNVFDELAMRVLREAAPYPTECKEAAGRDITVNFSPKKAL